MDLVVPDPRKSINDGAIEPWTKPHYRSCLVQLKRAAPSRRSASTCRGATDRRREAVRRRGSATTTRACRDSSAASSARNTRCTSACSSAAIAAISPARLQRHAAAARGARRARRRADDRRRLRADGAATRRRSSRAGALGEKDAAVADKILREIQRRLGFLTDVGLDYLTLDRLSSTLSGGESQRINLATSLGSALVDTLYVLDEPSIGLHPRDNERLIAILLQLRDQGNTVLVVEHDADMIRVADQVVDLGLGAGEQGGRIIYAGSVRGLLEDPRSLTAKYLRDDLAIPVPAARRRPGVQRLRITGRDRAQPQGHRRRDSARAVHVRDRRQRIGQVHARARRHLRRGQARQGRLGSPRRRAPRASKAPSSSPTRCWSISSRSAGRRARIR